MRHLLGTLITLFTFFSTIYAGTFDEVVTIFNNSCAFSACHDSENPVLGLDLSGDKESIYEQLIDVVPENQIAAAKNNLLVKPGDPARSFLYRKINYDLHNDSKLIEGELESMPTGEALLKQEIELVRQWILFGARNDSETYVDPSILEEYYTVGGLAQIEAPEAPLPGEGYQIQLGPIFLAPGEEKEYIYRYELQNEEAVEVNRVAVEMNKQSHHFLFFKFNAGKEFDQEDGLLPISFRGAQAITSDTKMVGGWAYSRAVSLPEKTAFRWNENEVLKLNYHILNYSNSDILPAKLYVNVYTQTPGTALKEMHSEFHLSVEENFLVGSNFPPGVSNHEWFMKNFEEAGNDETIHIWSLGSHTHKYGTDFDIYLNENGTQGEQVYEGDFNFDYTVNQGYYNFAEPAFRIFDEFLPVNTSEGLIIKGEYTNTSDQTVRIGVTTEDEMFGIFLNYLTGGIDELVAVEEPQSITHNWTIQPNPTKDVVQVNLPASNQAFQVKLYNAAGSLLYQGKTSPNSNQHIIQTHKYGSGIYMLQIQNDKFVDTQKIVFKQ